MLLGVPMVKASLLRNSQWKYQGSWLDAFLFALSVAVGLTPEMLPMIVSANLAKGAVSMSKKMDISIAPNIVKQETADAWLCYAFFSNYNLFSC